MAETLGSQLVHLFQPSCSEKQRIFFVRSLRAFEKMTDPASARDDGPSNTDDPMDDPDLDVNMEQPPQEPAPPENADQDQDQDEALLEAREPTKKDISLREFLSKMDDYAPIVSFRPHSQIYQTRLDCLSEMKFQVIY